MLYGNVVVVDHVLSLRDKATQEALEQIHHSRTEHELQDLHIKVFASYDVFSQALPGTHGDRHRYQTLLWCTCIDAAGWRRVFDHARTHT